MVQQKNLMPPHALTNKAGKIQVVFCMNWCKMGWSLKEGRSQSRKK